MRPFYATLAIMLILSTSLVAGLAVVPAEAAPATSISVNQNGNYAALSVSAGPKDQVRWDFDDGSFGSGPSTGHTWAPGLYNVRAVIIPASGWLADRIGRRNLLGAMAVLIGLFSFAAPWLLGAGSAGNNVFLLVGFVLLGLSYGQASGTVTANFSAQYRYTGAALSADLAWLLGAGFAPLVALGLSAKFGLGAVSVYLLSGAVCTLAALRINRLIERRES